MSSNNRNTKPLIIIVGPTAVGKTDISIKIAPRFRGEIVSADSRLFYRGMDIGTAKPNLVERRKVPHHLIDVSDPDEIWSLARFQKAATDVIQSILERGNIPFLVGGTGQYVHSIVKGWSPPSVEPDLAFRKEMENQANEKGFLWLHEKLGSSDPEAAKNIDPRNIRRTIRALEVIQATGEKFSKQKGKNSCPYKVLVIGLTLSRKELYERIDNRIIKMFSGGFLEEVSILLAKGYSPDLPSMSAIGYRECIEHISGIISLDEAERLIKKRTRVYVRRQANWFNLKDPQIHWFDVQNNNLENEISKEISGFLE
jgi:tRNA dimethylallyltransferase